MDNWGGTKSTYNRKSRRFFGKRKPLFPDEEHTETSDFKSPINYSTEKKDHKSIFAKRIKQNRIKNILVLSLTIIPLIVICFVVIQKTNTSLNKYAAEYLLIDSTQIKRDNLEKMNAYKLLIKAGNRAIKNKEYQLAIREYELALQLGIATKVHYDKLLSASILCCETTDKYCDRVAHYEKILTGLE